MAGPVGPPGKVGNKLLMIKWERIYTDPYNRMVPLVRQAPQVRADAAVCAVFVVVAEVRVCCVMTVRLGCL